MPQFIVAEIIANSFRRLRPRESGGKTHLERSSALLYFLAVDSTAKSIGTDVLNVSPHSATGRYQRRELELQFAKLVQLAPLNGVLRQVQSLGYITIGGIEPEKRLSSNFLTVPITKAATQLNEVVYPHRPTSAPLLRLGKASTGHQWGIRVHEKWSASFPRFFEQIPNSTFSFDLAVFLNRHKKIDDATEDIHSALESCLREQFSESVSEPWISRIRKERIYIKHLTFPVFESKYRPWEELLEPSGEENNQADLFQRVKYLESLLTLNKIPFD